MKDGSSKRTMPEFHLIRRRARAAETTHIEKSAPGFCEGTFEMSSLSAVKSALIVTVWDHGVRLAKTE